MLNTCLLVICGVRRVSGVRCCHGDETDQQPQQQRH